MQVDSCNVRQNQATFCTIWLKTYPLAWSPPSKAGLAIYAARGLRSGSAEITAVVFTAAVAGNYFLEKRDAEIGHLPGGFKCEFGGRNWVRKKSLSMRKLKLRELNAENCVN